MEQRIKELIHSFFIEMNAWEKYCNDIEEDDNLSYDEQCAKQTQGVSEIVNKYFTKKERKMGNPNCISYGFGGCYVYNPDEEKVVSIEVDKNIAIVTTERKKPQNEQNKYILKKIRNEWRIDSKKRFSVGKEKWVNEIL